MATIRKADASERIAAARAMNPAAFDRITKSAIVGGSSSCWPMTRSLNKDGYGVLRVNGRKQGAHRVMFGLFFPELSAPVVRHICHNPACVNPAHLRAGTPLDNAADRVIAGRGGDLSGEHNGRSKLDDESVRQIRLSQDSGPSLSMRYGVSRVVISRVRRGLSWRNI